LAGQKKLGTIFAIYLVQAVGLKKILEGTMKKMVLCILLAAGGGVLFAQPVAQSGTPAATIKGTLGLSSGILAVKSGNITYYCRGLERYIGFIDGLKDGAQVSIEGYAAAPTIEGQTDRIFYPVKLTINGKDYEVGSPMTGTVWESKHPAASGRTGRGASRKF
jgi:hypothetical protein